MISIQQKVITTSRWRDIMVDNIDTCFVTGTPAKLEWTLRHVLCRSATLMISVYFTRFWMTVHTLLCCTNMHFLLRTRDTTLETVPVQAVIRSVTINNNDGAENGGFVATTVPMNTSPWTDPHQSNNQPQPAMYDLRSGWESANWPCSILFTILHNAMEHFGFMATTASMSTFPPIELHILNK
jgi:hypothetical protein